MHLLDYIVFFIYLIAVLSIGYYFFRKNKDAEDYYVGGRSISSGHVGLSIVATDVGGGFSIGLGGLGFTMGLSGSWLLFTGLVGAWLSAVLIIPRIKKIDSQYKMMTYPDFLRFRFDHRVALTASVISGIGYLGFTGAQVLAGAKLAAATIIPTAPFGMEPLQFALYVIAVVIIGYTVMGGIKAVIYTDSVQWTILLTGLIGFAIPLALIRIGGFSALQNNLPGGFFTLTNLSLATFVNWMVTIIPIWLVAMTLYQRMFACKNTADAKKAWYLAGLFEYPVMAFMGVLLGMCGRVLFPNVEPEMGLPLMIKSVLPVAVTGTVVASYFSAIMSTADSCLMASSGNFVNDIIHKYFYKDATEKQLMVLSQLVTLIIGALAIMIAASFTTVLNAILYAYGFMVSGLFVPTLGAYFWKRADSNAALWGMLTGGGFTLVCQVMGLRMPWGLDPTLYGILVSGVVFFGLSLIAAETKNEPIKPETPMFDVIEKLGHSHIQHGNYNDRIYLMELSEKDFPQIIDRLDDLAREKVYSKIFVKIPSFAREEFLNKDYSEEGTIPRFYRGTDDAYFLGKYFSQERENNYPKEKIENVLQVSRAKAQENGEASLDPGMIYRLCGKEDIPQMVEIYKAVFETYPFPIHHPDYIARTMEHYVAYFGIWDNNRLVALSSSEMDISARTVEMTDFATLPGYRGNGLASFLLDKMEQAMNARGFKTAYTIARAVSYGMNITFAKKNYVYSGTLINNTNISGKLESMNIWYKFL